MKLDKDAHLFACPSLSHTMGRGLGFWVKVMTVQIILDTAGDCDKVRCCRGEVEDTDEHCRRRGFSGTRGCNDALVRGVP